MRVHFRSTIAVGDAVGAIELPRYEPDQMALGVTLTRPSDVVEVVDRVRAMAALDADPTVATAALAGDPLLGTLMSARRGLRVPGTWDPFEVGVRAIVGQQVSVAGATTVNGRIVQRHGHAVGAHER